MIHWKRRLALQLLCAVCAAGVGVGAAEQVIAQVALPAAAASIACAASVRDRSQCPAEKKPVPAAAVASPPATARTMVISPSLIMRPAIPVSTLGSGADAAKADAAAANSGAATSARTAVSTPLLMRATPAVEPAARDRADAGSRDVTGLRARNPGAVDDKNELPIVPRSAPAGASPGRAEKKPEREPGQLALYFPDDESALRGLQRIAQQFHLNPVQRTSLGTIGGILALFRTDGTQDLNALRTRLREVVPDAVVDFNARYYAQAGPRQYFPARIGLTTKGGGGAAVPMGIVDTEVANVAALANARIVRRSFLTGSDIPADSAHGTAVSLLLVGRDVESGFSGVAPEAALHAAAIMRRNGDHEGTNTLMLAQALDWLAASRVRVINLSLGGPGDALMARIFEKLVRLPLVVVAAAGNGGPDAAPSFPAAYPGVIAVTATNAADEPYANANHGGYITIAAPGEDIWIPDRNDAKASGEAAGRYVSGTSFSAAIVSGTVSRMLASAQDWDTVAVKRHLCRHARDLGAPGVDPVSGCGLLQTGAAWAAMAEAPTPKAD